MSGTVSDTLENPETFKVTEENVGELSYSQINQLYEYRGGQFSDYEIYCFQHNWGGSVVGDGVPTMSYIRDFCDPAVGEFFDSVDLGDYTPPPTYFNATNIEDVQQLLMESNYRLTEDELNQLYSNRNFGGNLYEQLMYTQIPQDYQINGITNAKDLIDYLSSDEYDSSKYDSILADLRAPGDKGADYHSDGFNTEVTHFAKTIQSIALAHADISNVKVNAESLTPSFTLRDAQFVNNFTNYVSIVDVDFDSFSSSIADYNSKIESAIATMFDDINNIKRNLMLIDDDFRNAFNEEMKEWFETFDFGDTGKDSFFTSDRVLSLLRDASESGLYNPQEKAVLQNIIDHSEYAQMNWFEKAVEGTKVFVISAAGGVAKVGENIFYGLVNLEAATVGQAVYYITGDDTIIRTCDEFIAIDFTGNAVDYLLGETCNVYYLENEGKTVRAVGNAVGEIGGTAIVTVCTGGAGWIVSGGVTMAQVSGKGSEKGLQEIYAIADGQGIAHADISTGTLLACNNTELAKGAAAGTVKILCCGYDTTDALGQTVHVGGIGTYMPDGSAAWLTKAVEKSVTKGVQSFENAGIEYVFSGGQYAAGFETIIPSGATAFVESGVGSLPVIGTVLNNDTYQNAAKIINAGAGTTVLPDAGDISGVIVTGADSLLFPVAAAEEVNPVEEVKPTYYQTVFSANNPQPAPSIKT